MSRPSNVEKESNVTKSPTDAPCAASVTVTVADPLDVVKGFVNDSVDLIGVMSVMAPSE
jgi:hypothetical protein